MTSFITGLSELAKWELRNVYFGADNCYFQWKEIVYWMGRHGHALACNFSHVWLESFDHQIGHNIPTNVTLNTVAVITHRDIVPESATFVKRITDNLIVWEVNEWHDETATQKWVTHINDVEFEKDFAVERKQL